MRPHVCLLLVLAALHARAASLPAPAENNFEKKLAEAVKEVLEKDAELQNVSSELELVEETNGVKDIDNKLLKKVGGDAIPVKVVVEEVKPALKASEEKKDCENIDIDDGLNIKRVEIDLKNPGEPQRQEHETQNPEHFENEHEAVTSIKKMISDAQDVFTKGFSEVTKGINELLVDRDPVISVKESIDNLRSTFTENIDKLNTTIQSFWNPNAIEDKDKKQSVQNVESGLKVLEDNFESGVETLTNGVEVLSLLKSDLREEAPSTTAKPASNNPLSQYFQNFQNSVLLGFGNVTNAMQGLFNNQGNNSTAAVAGAQSDEGAKPSTSRPPFWQSIQNFWGNGQQQQGTQNDESAPSGPFAQVIQNNPFVQGVINFIQPKPQQAQTQTAKPEPPKPVQSTDSEGTNAVPATEDKPADEQQQKEKPVQAAQPTQTQAGPIQQIIQRNPIVQGIAGAVNRIQSTIANPEKPREEPVEENEKAGFFPYGGYNHGGHRPGDEHNNDVDGSGVVKSAPVEKENIEKVSVEEKPEKVEPLKEEPPKEEPLKIAPETVEKEPSPEAPVKQD